MCGPWKHLCVVHNCHKNYKDNIYRVLAVCVTRINLITYLLQQLCEARTLVIPVSLGRDTDTTETVTSHDWQKKT